MVNVMKQLILLVLVASLLPQVALAAWWNPLSWHIFESLHKSTNTKTLNFSVTPPIKDILKNATATQRATTKAPTCVINLSPQTIKQGDTALLSWQTTGINPDNIAISTQEVLSRILGTGFGGKLGTSGSIVVAPTLSTEYSLNAYVTYVGGITCSTILTVLPKSTGSVISPLQSEPQQPRPKLDLLLQMLDDQIAEKHRQTEIALKQLQNATDEMKQLQAPIQSDLDALMKKIEQECPVSVYIGSQAQQCNVWRADAGILVAKIRGITLQYSAKIGGTPSLNFTSQYTSDAGQHYEIYYNGYGGGSIYNTSNPAENYTIYCSYNKCDIYGN